MKNDCGKRNTLNSWTFSIRNTLKKYQVMIRYGVVEPLSCRVVEPWSCGVVEHTIHVGWLTYPTKTNSYKTNIINNMETIYFCFAEKIDLTQEIITA